MLLSWACYFSSTSASLEGWKTTNFTLTTDDVTQFVGPSNNYLVSPFRNVIHAILVVDPVGKSCDCGGACLHSPHELLGRRTWMPQVFRETFLNVCVVRGADLCLLFVFNAAM